MLWKQFILLSKIGLEGHAKFEKSNLRNKKDIGEKLAPFFSGTTVLWFHAQMSQLGRVTRVVIRQSP